MSAVLLEGRTIAAEVWQEVESAARALARPPKLVVVQVGEDPASEAYTQQILRAFERHGLAADAARFQPNAPAKGVLTRVRALSLRPDIDAILVQTPLPAPLSLDRLLAEIPPEKDAEGVHPHTAGLLFQGRPQAIPSTPAAGMEVLRRAKVELVGSLAVVVGRSNIVGKPLAQLLLAEHATVVQAHSRTRALDQLTRQADVLAVAVGHPGLITAGMVKPGATVLDFGTTVRDGSLVGDVDFEGVRQVAGAITPVPGGIGPITTAMLARNVVLLAGSK